VTIATIAHPATLPSRISYGERIPELDGARGMAALAVVIAHYFGEVGNGIPLLTFGWVGVDLFFVLSGFLIGSIILERKDSPNFFSVFYIRRTARIFPVYFATIFLTLGFAWLLPHWSGEPLPALSYMTFTQNFAMVWRGDWGTLWLAPTWTLAVEEQFYLVIPLTVAMLPKRWLLPVILIGIALCFVTRALFYWTGGEMAARVLLFSRGDILLSGVLAAYIHQRYYLSEMVLRMIPLAAAIVLLLAAVQFRTNGGGLFYVASPLLIAALFAAYVLLAVRGWATFRFLRSSFWQMFGTISYCLYLIHQPVAGIMHGLILGAVPDVATVPQFAVTVAALFAAIGLAWGSWRLIEAPLLRAAREWRYGGP
jgi:peptidoglycan/LPS O-acetylase OafA/YrhL